MTQFLITTSARVKAQRDLSGSGFDSFVDKIIAGVSQMAEDYLGRRLLQQSWTEIKQLQSRRRIVSLDAFPITSVTSVRYAPTRDFSTVDPMDSSGYQVLLREGQIDLSGIQTWFERGFVQVIYTGGMATDTAGFIAAYPRIADAADNECVARLNRMRAPDGSPQALNSSVAYQEQLAPLTDFYAALDPHRRLRL